MSHPQLDNLVRAKQLKAELSAESELLGLVRSGKRRLDDASLASLSLESRFDLTYNAAHALSLAALRSWGYRSESRYVVFQCLPHTLDLPPEQWRVLDQAHRKGILLSTKARLISTNNLSRPCCAWRARSQSAWMPCLRHN